MPKIHPIQTIRQKRVDNLKSKISNKLENSSNEFYGQYHTFDEVYDFRRATNATENLIKNKPDYFSNFKYLYYLEKINLFGFDYKTLNKTFKHNHPALMGLMYEGKISAPFQKTKDIFYSQQEFINPSEESLNSDFDFSKHKNKRKLTQEIVSGALNKEEILDILEESKGLTLETPTLLKERYDKDTIYDFPLKFASACYNSRNQGSGYIADKIPEMFEGINEDELFKTIDLLSTRYRIGNIHVFKDIKINFKISDKNFYMQPMLSGQEARSYRITDNKNHSAILKLYYSDPNYEKDNNVTFAPGGLYGNIGMLREANKAGVVDVPDLYFANPIFIPIKSQAGKYMGGWAIVEDAENKKLKEGLMIDDWLEDKNLYHYDKKVSARVNGILVDFGFINKKSSQKGYNSGWGDKLANQVYSRYLNCETTDDLIYYLKNHSISYISDTCNP